MWRTLVVTGTLVAVLTGIVVLAVVLGPPTTPPVVGMGGGPTFVKPARAADTPPAVGGIAGGSSTLAGLAELVVIPNCHLTAIDKQEVPTLRDGQLLYVATELTPDERTAIPDNISDEELRKLGLMRVAERFVYAAWKPGDPETDLVEIPIPKTGKVKYRRVHAGEHLDGSYLEMVDRDKDPQTGKDFRRILRKLRVGNEVKQGQLLALVDPDMSVDDFQLKKTKLYAARADWEASVKTRNEAHERVKTLEKLRAKSPASVSEEEVRGAILTYDRYYFEEVAKKEAIESAKMELNQSLTMLLMHEVRAKVSGVIHSINHHRGDAVKNQETLMQIISHDRLRVEGRMEFQHLAALSRDSRLIVEPSQPSTFARIMPGHRGEVKAVAVSLKRNIVSGSDDSTARIWDRHTGRHDILPHPKPVLAVACTPEYFQDSDGNPRNLCLTGCADGYPRLWDIDKPTSPPVVFPGKHNGSINGVAFAPQMGDWCATGGEDKAVCLWNAKTGALIQRFENVHKAGITSVQFLSHEEILSAGKDNSLALLTLETDGTLKETKKVENRKGDVTFLGAHPGTKPNSQLALYDHGHELRILEMPGGYLRGLVQNRADSANFAGFALFSPDQDKEGYPTMILTGNANDKRFQLWRMPTSESRGYELRQYIWPGDQTLCGAFGPMTSDKPDDLFIVTGTRDHQVVLWRLPTSKEVQEELKAELTLKGLSIEGERELQIWAEVENKDHRLRPGQNATMVVYPPLPK